MKPADEQPGIDQPLPADLTRDERATQVEGERLVLELGQALHRYGTPAHRIELILERLSSKLGLQGQFFAVPTAIIASFGQLGEQRGGMVRLDPGGVDLGKLARLDEEIKGLVSAEQTPHQGLEEIHRIAAEQSLYPGWLSLCCFGIASAAAARFFGGGWIEIAVSLVIGLVLGLLAQLAERGTRRYVLVPVAAAIGAALAYSGQWLVGPYRVDVVTIAGLLYLLPGLTLTIAITELSTRHLVAGTARLTMAILVLLEMAFGVAIGSRISLLGPSVAAPVVAELPMVTDVVALVAAALSYLVLFRARFKDALWIVAACGIAYYGARFGSQWLGPQLGGWIGALVVGLACNAYARLLDRPPTVPLVPAILLLVPGSIGLRSVTWLLQDETVKAVDAAFEMALVGMALAVGMLVANLVLSPKRDL